MKCPICNIDLVMSERQGIEIDYCPECRGVWLDRGELDKIIDRSNQEKPTQERYSEPPKVSCGEEKYRNGFKDDNHSYQKKKRGGFLGDIFDFGD